MRFRSLLPALAIALAACGGDAGPVAPRPAPGAATAAPGESVTPGTPATHDAANAADASGRGAVRPWLDSRGTSILGFGLLRIVPAGPGPATFRIRYHEFPDGYATTGNLQLLVLPGDAFARKEHAFAGEFLAFARTADSAATGPDGALRVETSFTASRETVVLVAYGPWTAPDAGRPAGDVPTFGIDVAAEDGAFEWIESEAGEFITTNWTGRPEVERGTPARDPLDGADVWIEVRPMILYDGRLARTPDEPAAGPDGAAPPNPDTSGGSDPASTAVSAGPAPAGPASSGDAAERAADLAAMRARSGRQMLLTPALAERFRRVPIRWR